MAIYVLRDGVLVDKRFAAPLAARGPRGALPLPAIHRDHMDASPHPCTGQLIDSKSKFREITRAHGCEEVGNEALPVYTPPKIETAQETMAKVWEQLEQRSEDACPPTETTREHPDLVGQSMTIYAPHGTNTSPAEMAAAKQVASDLKAELRPAPIA